MAAKKQKYYVVWEGATPGVYASWSECQQQTKGVKGARFKSFDTLAEAQQAYEEGPEAYLAAPGRAATKRERPLPATGEVHENALAVDAACSGNPGMMEYRGVHVAARQQVFHFGPIYGTNNIGEFLAIVHALALQKQRGEQKTIYSDSRTAQIWVQKRKCKTTLARTPQTEKLYEIIHRAERWLMANTYPNRIVKWDTEHWGEIPADFGRK